MRNWKKLASGAIKPEDISVPILLKYVSDFGAWLKNVSPFTSLIFILFNLKRLFASRIALVCVLFLGPALILNTSTDILRLIFSICIFWIFFDKFKSPDKEFSLIVTRVIIIYTCVIFSGIFFPQFYLIMGGGTLRYKFILESHNALSILVFTSFVYVLNALISISGKKDLRITKWLTALAILLLCFIFLFIKSRLYIALSFVLVLFCALIYYKTSRRLILIPVAYAILFFGVTYVTKYFSGIGTAEKFRSSVPVKPPALHPGFMDTALEMAKYRKRLEEARRADSAYGATRVASKIVDNKRILSFSSTGRWEMTVAFFDLFKDLGWKQFLYQNNSNAYFDYKSRIPGIDVTASTLTENTYVAVMLHTGFVGLLVFLFIFCYFAWHFFSRKEYFSLMYFFLLMAVWFFEETVMFPFSLITHLFALATINRLERNRLAKGAGSAEYAGGMNRTG